MSRPREDSKGGSELVALVENIHVRVLNCSATGCLLESDKSLDEGTVATLDLTVGGRAVSDVVKVVRCAPADGTPGRYFIGARFLSIAPAHPGSLRHVMRHNPAGLAERPNAGDGQSQNTAEQKYCPDRKPETATSTAGSENQTA